MTRLGFLFLLLFSLQACNGTGGGASGGDGGEGGSAGGGGGGGEAGNGGIGGIGGEAGNGGVGGMGGSGGLAGSGGTGGMAGSGGTGGMAGSGGTGGMAGSGGTGGMAGSGGTGGMAGSGGTGGMAGSGGTGGMAGSGGTGGGPTLIDLEVVSILSNLDRPWDIGWLPNGTVVLTEREGRLNVYVDGISSAPFVIAPSDYVEAPESGMMGLEVDPNFSANGYVYVCMASDASGDTDIRVIRYTLATPNGDSVVGRTDIVTGMPFSYGRHSGCRPRFGPDGYLWVGAGDAAIYTTPQDDNSLGGKVLRVDRNGAAAPGNPDGYRWYSKGHRNIQGMAFRGSDGLGVSAEHGPWFDDEVNELLPGNFGWDPGPGYDEDVPMTDLVKFPEAIEAIWSSGSSTLAVSGAGFIEGSQWADWNGALAVACLRQEHLHIFFIDSNATLIDDFRAIEDQGRLRVARQGPDGLLYVLTDGYDAEGQVLLVSPVLSP